MFCLIFGSILLDQKQISKNTPVLIIPWEFRPFPSMNDQFPWPWELQVNCQPSIILTKDVFVGLIDILLKLVRNFKTKWWTCVCMYRNLPDIAHTTNLWEYFYGISRSGCLESLSVSLIAKVFYIEVFS